MREVVIGVLAVVPACAVLAQVIVERQRSELRDAYGGELAEVVGAHSSGVLVLLIAIAPVILDIVALVADRHFPIAEGTVDLAATLVSLIAIAMLLGLGLAAGARRHAFDVREDAVYRRFSRRVLRLPSGEGQRRAVRALVLRALRSERPAWSGRWMSPKRS